MQRNNKIHDTQKPASVDYTEIEMKRFITWKANAAN